MNTHRLTGAWCADLKLSLVGPVASRSWSRRKAEQAGAVELQGPVESSIYGVAERVGVAWPPTPLVAAEDLRIEAPAALGAASVRVSVDGDRVVRVANLEPDAVLDGFALHLSERRDGVARLLTVEAYPERDGVGAPIARRAMRIESASPAAVPSGAILSPAVEARPISPAPAAAPRPGDAANLQRAIDAARRVARAAGARPARAVADRDSGLMPALERAKRAASAEALSLRLEVIDPKTDLAIHAFDLDVDATRAAADAVDHAGLVDLKAVIRGAAARAVAAVRFAADRDPDQPSARAAGSAADCEAPAVCADAARVAQACDWSWDGGALRIEALDLEGAVLRAWRVSAPDQPSAERRRGESARPGPEPTSRRAFFGPGLRERLSGRDRDEPAAPPSTHRPR